MATASLVALSACGAVAGTANAQAAKTLTFTCKYPLVDKQPLELVVTADLPESARVNAPIPPSAITVKAQAKGDTARALQTLGVSTVEGAANLSASVVFPDGFVGDLNVPMAISKFPSGPFSGSQPLDFEATGQLPSFVFESEGTAKLQVNKLALSLKLRDQDGNLIVPRGGGIEDPVPDVVRDTFEIPCTTDVGQELTVASIDVTPGMEIVPQKVVLEDPTVDVCAGKVTLRWKAPAPGEPAVDRYVVTLDGGSPVTVPGSATSYTLPSSPGRVVGTIEAVDAAGNVSEPTEFTYQLGIAGCKPPLVDVTVGQVTSTSVELKWTLQATPYVVASYSIYRGTVKVGSTTGTTFTDRGLMPRTAYSYTVEAVTTSGLVGPKAPAVNVITPPDEPAPLLRYAIKGTTALKTLTTGNLPLSGGVTANVDAATGQLSADLTLNNTSGRLVAGSFLPLTAKVGFVPSGKTTGTLVGSTLKTNSKVRIKVLEVKLFGAIPLVSGNSCQTKQLSDIDLASTNAFDPQAGGTIAGTYKISDLNGCGVLNGLVSPLTAGGGNTISLTLTKQP